MKFIQISHPEVENPAVVSVRAAAAYAAKGWQLDEVVDDPGAAHDEGPRQLKRPQRNDSTAAWRTYAVALRPENGGISVAEAFGLSRDDLVAAFTTDEGGDQLPARNASAEAWRTYAVDHDMSPDEAASMGRDELVAHFDPQES